MGCAITQGYTIDCNKDSLGGISKLKIAARKDVLSYTLTDGVVTAIELAEGTQFYNFDLVKSSSNFTIAPTSNVPNGTVFYAESVTLVMNKLKASSSKLVDAISKASILMIIEDRNGEFFLLGKDNGLDLTGGTIGSGTAAGDRSGYELQFTGEEKVISHVDPTIISALTLPGGVVTYDTVLTYAEDTAAEAFGVGTGTPVIDADMSFGFNKLDAPYILLPIDMTIKIGGVTRLIVSPVGEYAAKPFKFIYHGTTYAGVFTNGIVNF